MARGKSRGKSARKAKRAAIEHQQETFEKVPHSFVFHRGTVGRTCHRLVQDMRHLFEPYTAASLRARKSNSLRDFVAIAGPLNVHFFIIFTKTANCLYMKVARVPHGPTLTFRVVRYSLAADVLSALRKYNVQPSLFCQPPLLILNGFTGSTNDSEYDTEENQTIKASANSELLESSANGGAPSKRPSAMHFSLITTVLQNAFAPLNVNRVKLDNVTRVAMFNFDSDSNLFEFRHYRVKAVPLGLSRPIRKLLKKNLPDLSRFNDVADFVERGASYQTTSESEAELLHDEDAHVVLPTKMSGRGNDASHKSAIRLFDIGPRMTLQLVKIEEGLCNGAVLFHAHVEKSHTELSDILRRRREKRRVKQERRRQQEDNVRRKAEANGSKRVRFNESVEQDSAARLTESEYEADGDSDQSDAGHRDKATSARNSLNRAGKRAYGSNSIASRPQPKMTFAKRRIPKFKMKVRS